MKSIDPEKKDKKDEYNEIMINGENKQAQKELPNMYERLNSQDRNLMDEMTHEYHVHKVTTRCTNSKVP